MQKNLPSNQKDGSFSFVLGLIAAVFGAAVVVAIASVLLHRIGINTPVPYGFILAVALLFSAGVLIRYHFGGFLVYFFAVACSVVVYMLATLDTGDVLVLGGTIAGEKPWAGYLGWCIVIGAFIFPLAASLLPEAWLHARSSTKQLSSDDDDLNFMYGITEQTDVMLLEAFECCEFAVEAKSDGTPVTQVDKEVEEYIRAKIMQKFPNDVVLGEEFESAGADLSAENKARRWIIDPIDGTKNFIRGVPIFATLIALEEFNSITGVRKPTKSIVSAPALAARWWASPKVRAWKFDASIGGKPKRIDTSSVQNLEDAFTSISSAGGWVNSAPEYVNFFTKLSGKVARTRGFGDFYSYMLLAQGGVDIATEPDLELYDVAALIPVVENAGGVFRAVDGNYWSTSGGIKSARASANRELDEQLQELYDCA